MEHFERLYDTIERAAEEMKDIISDLNKAVDERDTTIGELEDQIESLESDLIEANNK